MISDNTPASEQDLVQDVVATNWRLELGGGSNLMELGGSCLQSKRMVTDVDVCVHDSFANKATLEVVSLFGKVGCSLNGLRKLELYPGTGSYNAFPIEALKEALRESRRLESLYVYHLELRGDSAKFRAFAEQLERCGALKEVCFIDCRMSGQNEKEFDTILRSLGKIASLKVVALWAENLGAISSESLAQVCRSSSIERLMILGFEITDQHVASMCQELERNHTLKRLNLSCNIGALGCRSLSNMLRRNCKLEKLKIDLDGFHNENDLCQIAEGLKNNKALNYLKMAGHGNGSNEVEKAFDSMLQRNLSLQTLSVLDLHSSPTQELYLKLNRQGRGQLLRANTASRGHWIKALANCNDDLDALFYYLSVNPALVG